MTSQDLSYVACCFPPPANLPSLTDLTQSEDHDVFLRSSHDLFNDTVARVYSDPVVEHFDGIARLRETASLMDLAQWDAQNLPLEKLSVGRLRQWDAVG